MLTLVTSTPLMTFHMSPLAFFDAQSHGLQFLSGFPHRTAEEESAIIRLVRTPEGQGVGVLRANGTGEAYTVAKRGTELKQTGRWTESDFAVALWKGEARLACITNNELTSGEVIAGQHTSAKVVF